MEMTSWELALLIIGIPAGLGGVICLMAGWYYLCAEDKDDLPDSLKLDVYVGTDILWRLHALKRNLGRNPLAWRLLSIGAVLLATVLVVSAVLTPG